jgi:hypothetical protein
MAKHLTIEEGEIIKQKHAAGATACAIAKQLNRSQNTIQKFLDNPGVQKQIEEKKKDLISLFEDIAIRNLTSITDADIKGVSAYQRTLSAAVATDKLRLLRGESTDNISIIERSIREMQQLEKDE